MHHPPNITEENIIVGGDLAEAREGLEGGHGRELRRVDEDCNGGVFGFHLFSRIVFTDLKLETPHANKDR
jgi:hypothetical protein